MNNIILSYRVIPVLDCVQLWSNGSLLGMTQMMILRIIIAIFKIHLGNDSWKKHSIITEAGAIEIIAVVTNLSFVWRFWPHGEKLNHACTSCMQFTCKLLCNVILSFMTLFQVALQWRSPSLSLVGKLASSGLQICPAIRATPGCPGSPSLSRKDMRLSSMRTKQKMTPSVLS